MPTVKTARPATAGQNNVPKMMSDREIDRVLEGAHEAYRSWSVSAVGERAALLRRLAAGFRRHRRELALTAAREMGKVLNEGLIEADLCARVFEWYAANGRRILKDRPLEFPKKAYVTYEPLGVILSIQPWNFPYSQVVRNAAPVILAGNTMVLKHASLVPGCAALIERIFREAGAPGGLFSILDIPGRKASEIIADKRIRGVTFTGGVEAGRSVAEAAGRRAKPCVMELSGIDPMIVLEDADIDLAVETGVAARVRNAGQVCNAPKRMIVAESVLAEFIDRTVAFLDDFKVGDPLDEATRMGPLSSVDAARQVEGQIDRTIRQGATVVPYRGYTPGRRGAFLMPVVLTGVKPGMTAFDQEIFGPAVTIIAARDQQHAIELANDCRFALGASVFSGDKRRAESVSRAVTAGMIGINTMAGSTPELPYGGTKDSGYGRELSEYGVYEFMNHKLIRY